MQELIASFKDDLYLINRRTVFALVYTAVALSCIFYLKNQVAVAEFLHDTALRALGESIVDTSASNLPALTWWGAVVTVFYVIIPTLAIKFLYRRNLSEFGLAFRVEDGFWKLFAVCTAVMLPLVYLMSLTAGFSEKYPFLRIYDGEPYIGTTLIVWELIYFAQFFGLEFFFRGFLVHSLKPALGIYSIFAMTVPYCMIHFGKPPAETMAAIFAGIFLGWLSYRNGNIWMGLLLHCTVAISMDILALFNKGLLF
jgi:membrane protease YdiL (CAAX protease family)